MVIASVPKISNELFADFLNCPYKAYLRTTGIKYSLSEFEKVEAKLEYNYKNKIFELLRNNNESDVIVESNDYPYEKATKQVKMIIGANTIVKDLHANFDILESVFVSGSKYYIPQNLLYRNKINLNDKLLLSFGGFVLQKIDKNQPNFGKLIYGVDGKTIKVKFDKLRHKTTKTIGAIRNIILKKQIPIFRIIDHCKICQFSNSCHESAVLNDDLSVLRTLKEKEILKLNKRGVFKLKQLSYLYRPRKKRKRFTSFKAKYEPSLHALANSQNKIFIVDKPHFADKETHIYLDIEGIPDRDFYYLIGMNIVKKEQTIRKSLWAENDKEEELIYNLFLDFIYNENDFNLLHYGQYDLRAIEKLNKKYGGNKNKLKILVESSVNVLSLIYGRLYFPVYSNDLKSIASCLGFKWTSPLAGGIQSIIWRYEWELTHKNEFKNSLIAYNQEDCSALKAVTDVISWISQTNNYENPALSAKITETDNLPRKWPRLYKRNTFYSPELDRINQCAYFDYQREKIFFRTNKLLKKKFHTAEANKIITTRINKIIECERPLKCAYCPSKKIYKHNPVFKNVRDLKIFNGGIKRWNVKYLTYRYICNVCKRTFLPKEYPKRTYGNTLRAWIVYQNIALLKSHEGIVQEMREIFKDKYKWNIASQFKEETAILIEPTYKQILRCIRNGNLVHVDETKITTRDGSGYVWAITNFEDVAYFFTDTRHVLKLTEILEGFNGVLVSDFYAAYDSFNCAQQKCLIHLIRDINDDLFKHPFDDDLKAFAANLTLLIAPIIETIDRYGLKRRFLNKHKILVKKFFKKLRTQKSESEALKNYQRRLLKYKDKLFTFLEHDGVPWNNNNAENAIKKFAFLRRVIGGSSTKKGLNEYLILLSVCETLKRKNKSFLQFLLNYENSR